MPRFWDADFWFLLVKRDCVRFFLLLRFLGASGISCDMETQFHGPRKRIDRDNFASAASKTKISGLPRQRFRRVNPKGFLPLFYFVPVFLYGPTSAPRRERGESEPSDADDRDGPDDQVDPAGPDDPVGRDDQLVQLVRHARHAARVRRPPRFLWCPQRRRPLSSAARAGDSRAFPADAWHSRANARAHFAVPGPAGSSRCSPCSFLSHLPAVPAWDPDPRTLSQSPRPPPCWPRR